MSAFVVSTVHIDAMLTAGLRLEQPNGRDPLVWFWPASEAAAFCAALQSRANTCLPGYAAPWEIDDAQVFSIDRR